MTIDERTLYKKILYKKAYRTIDKVPLLRFDCGILCNKKCCSGNEDMGMCLFPGEDELYNSSKSSFLELSREFRSDFEIGFATCNGTCNRKYRPLSCRIYPFTPYLDSEGSLKIIQDPRAKYFCPILYMGNSIKQNPRFKRSLYKVFRLLIQDSDIRAFILSQSQVLDEYMKFTENNDMG